MICNDCKQYYELQPGGKPEDFNDKCHCNGILIYKEDLDFFNSNRTEDENDNQRKKNMIIKSNRSSYSFNGDLDHPVPQLHYQNIMGTLLIH